jgi:hypothetical protein
MKNPQLANSAAKHNLAKRFLTLNLLAAILFFLGMVRIFYVVTHDPMMGFANQYDMGRTAACLDLWPDFLSGLADRAYPDAPIEKHRFAQIASQHCYPSTEVVIDRIALTIDAPRRYFLTQGEVVDLRTVGIFKALLLMAIAWIIRRALSSNTSANFLHAMVFCFVLADPVYTLYFNTLYGEFAATLGMYAAIASMVAFVIKGEPSAELLTVFCIGTLCLAFSRMQHLVLPFIFIAVFTYVQMHYVVAANPSRWTGTWRICVFTLFISSLIAVFVNVNFLERNPIFKTVNRINMLMGAFVPASDDPAATLRALELPDTCMRGVYSNFYTQTARGTENACPEALGIPTVQLLKVMLLEPKTTLTMWGRGMLQSGDWRLPTVGEIAGTPFQRVGAGALGLSQSVSIFSYRFGFNAHVIFWLLPLVSGVIVALFSVHHRRNQPTCAFARSEVATVLLSNMLALVIASAWGSALLGDGFSEMLRHVHLGLMAALASWVLLVCLLFQRRLFVTALLIATTAMPLAVFGFRSLPLAVGELRPPLETKPLKLGDTLNGWAVAPYGIAGVDIEHAGSLIERVSVRPSSILQNLMPMASGRYAYEFTPTANTVTAIVQGAAPVEAYVVRIDGRRQRIDRR